ncbi:MAG: beta-ketoacyl-ACP synthase III [Alphaproteobacteria bacterium]|jgi:beta-ketodecanoyl-[acyl-carrier-protein] synthase|nr:beta-ketoacyl-ACP synthase III [Alphaproteobacteria bacterium]
MYAAAISGTGLFTPPNTITNDELVEALNAFVAGFNAENAAAIEAGTVEALSPSSDEFIVKASGIRARYVLDKEGVLDIGRMAPSLPTRGDDELSIQAEMAIQPARDAIAAAGLEISDIDGVICAASNMQRAYPAMSIEIQAALGMDAGWAFDMNVACSSATFGIDMAAAAVRSGQAKRILMINPEICSAHLNWENRDCHFIFGDVCTAAVIEREDLAVERGAGPVWSVLGSKLKTQFSNNIRNNFGFLNRTETDTRTGWDVLFKQEGRKVFKEVVPMVAQMIGEHLSEHDLSATDVRRFWLHQANKNMNDFIAQKVLGRVPDEDEAPVVLDEFANTSSAGCIIAFHRHSGDLGVGDRGVLCSFGAGYSAGSVIVRRAA